MQNCHQPEVYALVAAQLGKLHSVPLQDVPGAIAITGDSTRPSKHEPCIWNAIAKFIQLADGALSRNSNLTAEFRAFGVTLEWARRDATELRALCEAEGMPVVFAHNDLLLANLMYNSGAGRDSLDGQQHQEVTFIDFEFSGPNYAPYDVAYHFNEFAGVEAGEIDYESIRALRQGRTGSESTCSIYNYNGILESAPLNVNVP